MKFFFRIKGQKSDWQEIKDPANYTPDFMRYGYKIIDPETEPRECEVTDVEEFKFAMGWLVANYALAQPEEGEVKDHINPSHYKDYMSITLGGEFVAKLQWMEAQQFKPFFRKYPRAFVQAVLMQADKYLSRMGQKDDETQEMLKALWYTKFAAAFMKNGLQPIRIDDIPIILEEFRDMDVAKPIIGHKFG